jgi:hypothetical protein
MPDFSLRFCVVGEVDPALVPNPALLIPQPDGSDTPLRQVFFRSSGTEVNLHPTFGFLQNGAQRGLTSVSAAHLQRILPSLLHNPPGMVPVPNLGVLLAPSYGPRESVFGMMFDVRRPIPGDMANNASNAMPREACAIFLNSIFKRRGPLVYAQQLAFTLVHEIGHLFNMQHVEPAVERCFLNSSTSTEPPPPEAFQFTITQSNRLVNCTDMENAPGGNDFGDGGIWDNPVPRRCRRIPPRSLKLQIATTPAEFWPWEPIELDIKLRCGRKSKPWKIPDKIDPGYRSFEIWITEPDGTRRRFRSPRRYCAFEAEIACSDKKPFVRDVSLFWSAEGYTFSRPGVHEITARLFLPGGICLESNTHRICIRSRTGLPQRAQQRLDAFRELLIRSRSAFYHRRAPDHIRQLQALEYLAGKFPREHVGAAATAILGKWFATGSRHRTQSQRDAKKLASRLLNRAIDHHAIGTSRRKNLQKTLETL